MASTYTLTEHQVLKKKQEKKFTSSKEFLIELSKTLNITITNNQDIDLYFNIIGIDVAIVNSYRRIILSEVSTMAVDEVHMIKNDSVIPDEVLAHRFGMVPFDIDPRAFFTKSSDKFHNNDNETVKFRIEIKNNFTTKEIEKNEQLQYLSVYSDCLKWIPLGQQRVRLVNDPKPICKDILLAKLSQKQEIVADMYCLKSNGMDHAKFSPVATASYKLLSKIEILRDIYGDEAK
ncbi:DNA-directed RNA polymerases I and III subunit RPAC1, partial [Intoshia linei]